MSKSYWLSIIALGLTLSSAVAAESAKQPEPSQPEDQWDYYTGDYSANLSTLDVHILEEPEEAERAKRSQQESAQREIDDLVTQKRMADAADESVRLTKLQFILGIVGALALFYSLHLTRKTVKSATAANRLMESEQRAWLSVTLDSAVEVNGGKNMVALEAIFETRNFGNTPATFVRLYSELITDPDLSSSPEDGLNVFAEKCRARYPTDGDTLTFAVFPNASHRPDRPTIITGSNANKSIVALNCCVFYRSGLAPEVLHTGAVFTIMRSSNPASPREWLAPDDISKPSEVEIRNAGVRSMR